jgi:hypothetical protein
MVAGTFTSTGYTGDGTQAGFLNAIATEFTSRLNMTLFDSYTATHAQRVFSINWGTGKNFSTNYLRVGFSGATALVEEGATGWNATTHVGTNNGTITNSATIGLSNNFVFNTINHPEIKLIQVYSGTTPLVSLGLVRPSTVPSGLNEDTHPYCFIPDSTPIAFGFNNYFISSLRPSGIAATANRFAGGQYITALSTINGNNGYAVVGGMFMSNDSTNLIEKYSSDIGWTNTPFSLFGDVIVTPGTEEYKMIATNSGSSLRTIILRSV